MTLDFKFLSGYGTYTLLLFVSKDVTVTVGRLGKRKFPRGYYSYTGSALGKGATCLKNRVARHLKKEKRCFWHIDYLLADQNVSVEAVVRARFSLRLTIFWVCKEGSRRFQLGSLPHVRCGRCFPLFRRQRTRFRLRLLQRRI